MGKCSATPSTLGACEEVSGSEKSIGLVFGYGRTLGVHPLDRVSSRVVAIRMRAESSCRGFFGTPS